jgi:hypothetical protein
LVLELVGHVSELWAVFLSGRGSGAFEVRLEVEDRQNAMKTQANEPNSPNPAISSGLHSSGQRRGLADSER